MFILAETFYWRLIVLPRLQAANEGGLGGVAAIAFVLGVWLVLRRGTGSGRAPLLESDSVTNAERREGRSDV